MVSVKGQIKVNEFMTIYQYDTLKINVVILIDVQTKFA